MSGPKVVRVVSREERIAIANGQLARLDKVALNWKKECNAMGINTDSEAGHFDERIQYIHTLLEKGAFQEIQTEVENEVAFLKNDLKEKRETAIKRKSQARQRKRRLSNTASTLLSRLKLTDLEIPEEQLITLQNIQNGSVDEELAENTISAIFNLIVPEDQGLTEQQKHLAQKLGEGEEVRTLAQWLAGHPAADDAVGQKIDRFISKLQTIAEENRYSPFVERVRKMNAEPSPSKRRLLSDSIQIELAAEISAQENRLLILEQIDDLCLTLNQYENNAYSSLFGQAEDIKINFDDSQAKQLISDLGVAIESAKKAYANIQGRKVLLGALEQLGYDVREGMLTAWVKDGNVTMRNQTTTSYGVKVSGGVEGGPLQIRPVKFDRSASSYDAETQWCSKFSELKQHLENDVSSFEILAATPVGQIPVEYVEDGETRRNTERKQLVSKSE